METICRKVLVFLALGYSSFLGAQSSLIVSGAAYVVLDNQVKLVIDNASQNAVSSIGLGGIITESEFDQVVWRVSNNTGTYTMPFVSGGSLTKIPFSAAISVAGTGSGAIWFSTYPGPTWDNNTYRPTGVTNMGSISAPINNSDNVIDRFWIIDPIGYTIKPTATFQFTYLDSEHSAIGNTIIEAGLAAQRFNTTTNQWGDYLPQGTTNTTSNTTSGVPVSPANFFRSWTLSELTSPLAADILAFQQHCSENELLLEWLVSAENNVDYYELEVEEESLKSNLVKIDPTDDPIFPKQYSYTSTDRVKGLFYLSEVDLDGNKKLKGKLFANCAQFEEYFTYTDGGIIIAIQDALAATEPLIIYDASGKIVFETIVELNHGNNTLFVPNVNLSKAMYLVKMGNTVNLRIGKILI